MNQTDRNRPESLSTRVRRGVALLDEKVPGWHQRIDVDELDLRFCTTCIVGQLFGPGSFWGPLRTLTGLKVVGYDESRGYGFDVDPFVHDYKALERLWSYVVRTRQATQQWLLLAHREGGSFDVIYRVELDGEVTIWTPDLGWHESAFHNLRECSEYDQRHFADHLVSVSVDELPVGAR